MIYDFAALLFTEDENLADRIYWYLADFAVCINAEVLAPVGPHDRLQKARVVKICACEEADAPYDIRLIKHIAAASGDRKRMFGETVCSEFGGLRYDGRHFTAYHVLMYAENRPQDADMVAGYGVDMLFHDPKTEDRRIYEGLILGHGILLVGGEGKEICTLLLDFLRGKPAAEERLREIGLDARSRTRLSDALTRQRKG